MGRWDAARVAALAPDAPGLAAARKLARPGPWSGTGCSDVLVWGRCQGSGSTPYQTSVDLTGPAFRCSCPSRKFPCKHALALLMLWSDGTVGEGGIDEAAAAWAAERAGRSRQRPAAPAASAPDPAARARRLAERLQLMDRGAEDTSRWLADVVRAGLAEARGRDAEFWDAAARRLVDAQLPGLAVRVRHLPVALAGEDWTTTALDEVGLLWSLLRAWQRRDLLAADDAASLRVAVGWTVPTSEVREQDSVRGRWTVLGVHRSEEGRIAEQRTWLRAEDGELLLVLDFAGGGTSLPVPQLVGQVLRGGMSRYPGPAPRRALLHEDVVADPGPAAPVPAGDVAAAFRAAAEHLERDPWTARTPVVLAGRVVLEGAEVRIADATGASVRVLGGSGWLLAALTGGGPVEVFGELEEGALRPLSAVVDGGRVAL